MDTLRADPHPMITPLTATPPDKIASSYSDPAVVDAYRIVWNNTLAYMTKQPLVREHRALFATDSGIIAVGSRHIERAGWLKFQNIDEESPTPAIPDGVPDAQILVDDLVLSDLVLELPQLGTPPNTMIAWLSEYDIASPGTLASLLARMEAAGWVDWPEGEGIRISAIGTSALAKLDGAGFVALDHIAIRNFRAVLDAHEMSGVSSHESAKSLFASIGMALNESVDWLDGLDAVPNHRAQDAYSRARLDEVTPPVVRGYPASIDPEVVLPPDAEARKTRLSIERAMVGAHGEAWFGLTAKERAQARLVFFAEMENIALDELQDRLRFDILLRWMVGVGT